MRCFFILAGVWLAVFILGLEAAENPAARVVILANASEADSLRVAKHYAEARGVPEANLIALPMPARETMSWREFVATIWQPLQDELIARDWIQGVAFDLVDGAGRKKNAVSGHRIAYLVVCRGVPLRIEDDAAVRAAESERARVPAQLRTSRAAVDSELALLAQVNPEAVGLVANPLFNQERPTALLASRVVKVSRLDAPTTAEALALVDRALTAERDGLIGRAYLDLGGPHQQGERWLEATAKIIERAGYDLDVDRARATMPATARCDAPALYFGWYTTDLNGPFALPGFRFAPGAIALHIHSFSAQTLRSEEKGWTGPLLARGVTATVGNVFEPYLQFTHRPDLLMRALERGSTWGDAVTFALPALSWQAVAIGDPLYRPFARSSEAVWRDRKRLPASLVGYAALREAHLRERGGHERAATELLRNTQKATPSLAVALALAERAAAQGDKERAASALGVFSAMTALRAQDWALAAQAGEQLRKLGQAAAAVRVYRNLIEACGAAPKPARVTWLEAAKRAAEAAGDLEQAMAWTRTLAELTSVTAEK